MEIFFWLIRGIDKERGNLVRNVSTLFNPLSQRSYICVWPHKWCCKDFLYDSSLPFPPWQVFMLEHKMTGIVRESACGGVSKPWPPAWQASALSMISKLIDPLIQFSFGRSWAPTRDWVYWKRINLLVDDELCVEKSVYFYSHPVLLIWGSIWLSVLLRWVILIGYS